jgi:predicted neutral ceramidase superfamily lipid hydrolase
MSIVSVLAHQPIGRREQDVKIRDSIVASVALAISTLAMAGVVASGAYAQAAGAEARGVHALSATVAHTLCKDPAPAQATLAAATLEVVP